MLSRSGRPLAQVLFGPVAKLFVKAGISANLVTVIGTVATCALALWLIPSNQLVIGPLAVTVVVLFDNLDGQIARLSNTVSQWGAFLDSTMDRLADAAVFVSLIIWGFRWADEALKVLVMTGALAALVFGSIVPYVRARAEAIGKEAAIGLAERADRLVFVGVCTLLVGFGLSHWILAIGLWVLAFLAAFTVIQRMHVVYHQCARQDQSGEG